MDHGSRLTGLVGNLKGEDFLSVRGQGEVTGGR